MGSLEVFEACNISSLTVLNLFNHHTVWGTSRLGVVCETQTSFLYYFSLVIVLFSIRTTENLFFPTLYFYWVLCSSAVAAC